MATQAGVAFGLPIKNLLRGGLVWTPTELSGIVVAERNYQMLGRPPQPLHDPGSVTYN
jgi:hypothetical protein